MTTYQLAFSGVPTANLELMQRFLKAVFTNQTKCITAKQRMRAFEKLAFLNEVLKQRALLEAI